MNTSVTVVVPVFRVEKYIEESIKSLVNQTLSDIEILIVDDGSDDRSVSIAEEVLKQSGRIYSIVSQENAGLSVARNTGIEQAKGEYVCWIDSDDTVSPEHVESLYRLAKENDLNICCSDFEPTTEKNREGIVLYKEESAEIKNKEDFLNDLLRRKPAIHCCTIMARKEYLTKNDFWFNPLLRRYGEDVEFMWRVFPATDRIGKTNSATYKYLYHGDSMMTVTNTEAWDIFLAEWKRTIKRQIDKSFIHKKYYVWAYYRTLLGWIRVVARNTDYDLFLQEYSKLRIDNMIQGLKSFPDIKTRIIIKTLDKPRLFYWLFHKE